VGRFDSHNLETVKAIWDAYEREGQEAGMEALIAASADDVEFRPYGAGDEVLRGPEALRDYFRRSAANGSRTEAGVYDFVPSGDTVRVNGWVRIIRPDGGLADAQVQWEYSFRDGKVASAAYEPAPVAA
jgi:ketosteroid isomerase-like protein